MIIIETRAGVMRIIRRFALGVLVVFILLRVGEITFGGRRSWSLIRVDLLARASTVELVTAREVVRLVIAS